MRKVGLIAAAAILAALPFTVDGAFAQGKGGVGGGGGAAVGGGGGMKGGGAAIGGGGMRGGGAAIGGGFKGGMGGGGVAMGGGGPRVGWAGRPGGGWSGGQHWAGRPGGWNGGRRYWGPGIGFGTGLALGAFAASPYYYGGYGYDDQYYYDSYPADDGVIVGETSVGPGDVAACAARYRSYDVRTQTFLGYDGQRHPCP